MYLGHALRDLTRRRLTHGAPATLAFSLSPNTPAFPAPDPPSAGKLFQPPNAPHGSLLLMVPASSLVQGFRCRE